MATPEEKTQMLKEVGDKKMMDDPEGAQMMVMKAPFGKETDI